jgi:hypothetical protein
MTSIKLLIAVTLLAATSGYAQGVPTAVAHPWPVYMTAFDQSANTFNGYMHDAAACPARISYTINLSFAGAKNEDEARAQLRDQQAKIETDIAHATATCQR